MTPLFLTLLWESNISPGESLKRTSSQTNFVNIVPGGSWQTQPNLVSHPQKLQPTSKQTANTCCGGGGFFGMLYLGEKPSSEDLMRVHWKFLVFLETLEGLPNGPSQDQKGQKYRTKAKQWFHYTNEMGRRSEILSIPQDWLHLEVRRAAWSDLTLMGSITINLEQR